MKKKKPPSIAVGRGKSRRVLPIKFEPVYLSKEEDEARIKRLSEKILRVVESARKRPPVELQGDLSEQFESDLEKKLGL